MSMTIPDKTQCPDCGAEIEFTFWESLNSSLDPDEARKLRRHEFGYVTCPKCGKRHLLLYPILYHDMDAHAMVRFMPAASRAELAEGIKGEQKQMQQMQSMFNMPKTRLRAVADYEDLCEKARIFFFKLDDRTIELMKALMRMGLQQAHPELKIEDVRFVSDNEEKVPGFVFYNNENECVAEIQFNQEVYDETLQSLKQHKDDEALIDRAWAIRFLDEMESSETDPF